MTDYKSGERELSRRLADLLNSAAILSPVGATIPMAQQLANLSRSGIYRLLEARELDAVKRGHRTLISWESLSAYLANLPTATFGKSASSEEGK
jgi:excisionase family DNA binding protein